MAARAPVGRDACVRSVCVLCLFCSVSWLESPLERERMAITRTRPGGGRGGHRVVSRIAEAGVPAVITVVASLESVGVMSSVGARLGTSVLAGFLLR